MDEKHIKVKAKDVKVNNPEAPEKVRKIRTYTSVAANSFNGISPEDDKAEEHEDETLHDSDRLSGQISDSVKRVKNLVQDEKRRKLEEDRNAGKINAYGDDDKKNITRPQVGERKEVSEINLPRKQLNDSREIGRINNAAKNEVNFEALDKNFEVPKKRESIFDAFKKKKDTYFADKKLKYEAAKKEG